MKSMNIYALKRGQKYTKQKLTELKGKIDNSTIIVGDFNITFSIMNRHDKHNINKEIEDFNNTIN